MVKLLVLSDLHLEFGVQFLPDAAATTAAHVIVLAGDIDKGTAGITWARQAFPDKPILYVCGNHEFYGYQWESLIDELREAGRMYDVSFLEDESIMIHGVRFLGCTLWTDFDYHGPDKRRSAMFDAEKQMNDYRLIKAKPLPEIHWRVKPHRLTSHHTLQRHRQSRAWLEGELGKGDPATTVVVTHNYVHLKSTAPQYKQDLLTTAFGSVWPEEVLARANLWIHGYTHTSCDYLVGGMAANARVLCNPRGYPSSRAPGMFENPHFSASVLAQVTTSEDATENSEAEAVLTRAPPQIGGSPGRRAKVTSENAWRNRRDHGKTFPRRGVLALGERTGERGPPSLCACIRLCHRTLAITKSRFGFGWIATTKRCEHPHATQS